MASDTAPHDPYAELRAVFAARNRPAAMATPQPPVETEPPIAIEPGPCEDCAHRTRCRVGLACERFATWVAWGRDSDAAPRQPSAEIYWKVFRQPVIGRPRLERQRIREVQAVKNARETRYLDLVEGL